MIIWTGKETEPHTEAPWRWVAMRWRWVCEVFPVFPFSIEFSKQHNRNGGPWEDGSGEYFGLSVTKYFSLGPEHMYYDGPHCSFSIGWLHIFWSLGECKKCMPDGE